MNEDKVYVCAHCGPRASTEFGTNKARPNGMAEYCRDCDARRKRDARRRNKNVAYLLHVSRPGVRAWDAGTRRKWDGVVKQGMRVYVEVTAGGEVYQWRQWRTPAYPSMEEWLTAMVTEGMEVRVV